MISELTELEQPFAANGYNGTGDAPFSITPGRIPIMVSAPHAVNHYREGEIKKADLYTGALGVWLQQQTGCHLICSSAYSQQDPNFDRISQNPYQQALLSYVGDHGIRVLLDLHGASAERAYAVELGTSDPLPQASPGVFVMQKPEEDPSLKEYKFIAELAQRILERAVSATGNEKNTVEKNRKFAARGETRITRVISENSDTACMQLEINRIYRDPDHPEEMKAMAEGLKNLVNLLGDTDWKGTPWDAERSARMLMILYGLF